MKQIESETIFRANRKFEIEIAFAHRPTTKIIAIGTVRESESDEGAKRKARTGSEKIRSSWSGGSLISPQPRERNKEGTSSVATVNGAPAQS